MSTITDDHDRAETRSESSDHTNKRHKPNNDEINHTTDSNGITDTQHTNGHTDTNTPPTTQSSPVILPIAQDKSVEQEHSDAVEHAVHKSLDSANTAQEHINQSQSHANSALGLIAAQNIVNDENSDEVYNPDEPDIENVSHQHEQPNVNSTEQQNATDTTSLNNDNQTEHTNTTSPLTTTVQATPTDTHTTNTTVSTNNSNTQQVDIKTVYVACLPSTWTAGEIRELFETYGDITELQLINDPTQRQLNRGIAFVHYKNAEDAQQAIEGLNNMNIGTDKFLQVKYANPRNTDKKHTAPAPYSHKRKSIERSQSNERTSIAASTTGSIMEEENTIYISHMPRNIVKSDIEQLLRPYGTLLRVSIPTDTQTGKPKGIAFAKLTAKRLADRALAELNGKVVMGWHAPIQVRWATKGKHGNSSSTNDNKQYNKPSSTSSSYQTTNITQQSSNVPNIPYNNSNVNNNVDPAKMQQLFQQFMQSQQMQQPSQIPQQPMYNKPQNVPTQPNMLPQQQYVPPVQPYNALYQPASSAQPPLNPYAQPPYTQQPYMPQTGLPQQYNPLEQQQHYNPYQQPPQQQHQSFNPYLQPQTQATPPQSTQPNNSGFDPAAFYAQYFQK